MESPAQPLPIPRLRLSRHSPSHVYHPSTVSASSSSQAGPSHLPDVTQLVDLNLSDLNTNTNTGDDELDQYPTPKMSNVHPPSSSSPADTPAARLRALLTRVPNHRATATPPPAQTPSEHESDFEPPDFVPVTPTIMRDSLKDIFSRALREPGDTPQKGRRRRNSIDTSEVDASPRVERERSSIKGKRKSLSDEEVEHSTKSPHRYNNSSKTPRPITLDILRERYTNLEHTEDLSPASPYRHDDSNDTATIMRDLNSSRATPPAATSTPQHSLRMSVNSQYQFQSNLLDQDSEMQREIEGLDSYEGDSAPIPEAEWSSLQPKDQPSSSTVRPYPTPSHAKSSSLDKSHGSNMAQRNMDIRRNSSRSSLGSTSSMELDQSRNQSVVRDQEWNRPGTSSRTGTPDLKQQRSHSRISMHESPIATHGILSRRGSSASLRSFDDESSRGSSFGSQAEYRERVRELERERNIEREREWNRPHSRLSRPSSSLSLRSPEVSVRSRTQSLIHPPRPGSALSQTSVNSDTHKSGLRRHQSFTSPRASSPTGSLRASHDDELPEVVHERERNWNAPRPKWHQSPSVNGMSVDRTSSPVPQSLGVSSNSSQHSHPNVRTRAESLKSPGSTNGEIPAHYASVSNSNSSLLTSTSSHKKSVSPRAPSPHVQRASPNASSSHSKISPQSTHRPNSSRNISFPERPVSPLANKSHTPTSKLPSANRVRTQSSSSSLVRNRTPLSPYVAEKDTPERRSSTRSVVPPSPSPTPGARPSSRASQRTSHIPVRSPQKAKPAKSVTYESNTLVSESEPELRYEGPSIHVEAPFTDRSVDLSYEQNSASEDMDALSQERTPTLRTIPPPPSKTPEHTPPRSPSLVARSHTTDEARLQNALSLSVGPDSSRRGRHSPLPSPPAEELQPNMPSFLATPPRRSSFNTSKLEFQTPSPPRGLPELPGPPSSEDEQEQESQWGRTPSRANADDNPNWTNMKTPRPPGAMPTSNDRNSGYTLENNTPVNQHNNDGGANWTAVKTPKPPGAWTNTPAPVERTRARAQSISTEPDQGDSYNGGLVTPVPSLSRASSLPAKTPAPPGSWKTPGPSTDRKSIMKVRFDGESVEMKAKDELTDSTTEMVGPSHDESFETTLKRRDSVGVRSSIPEPQTPVSPPTKHSRSPRKSASIRVLDTFGREQDSITSTHKRVPVVNQTPRSKSGIRIVDAMGQEVEEQDVSAADESMLSEIAPPLNRGEALLRVRQGLDDLVQGLDEIDRPKDDTADDVRIKELDAASRASRETREQLFMKMYTQEADLRSRFRESVKEGKRIVPTNLDRRLSGFTLWRMIALFLVMQLVFYLLMYRLTLMRAKSIFLTTYYDPFNPDLHLYTAIPNTYDDTFSSTQRTAWRSIPGIFVREGWKASQGRVLDNIRLLLANWQQGWLDSSSTPTVWPPT
ncbi:hypothetical protein BDQ12DRAFT_673185 [Crucibulum laeve]|uniref:Uncharacterized protein n=1 Tax=Crucibulum laeve TaxID=68775 RepID=A0A5C3MGM5_9AGAR|nr:hypothetical protein BDQ12DRAFT_673185 [Crucibulum laeve]